MTVRAWFTISAVVVVALAAAVVLKLFSATPAPPIVARVGDVRLDGQLTAACWPQRDGKAECTKAEKDTSRAIVIPGKGTFRIVVAYPVQPKDGYIEVREGEEVVFRRKWSREVMYDLGPGRYRLVAFAKYADTAQLRYSFSVRVR